MGAGMRQLIRIGRALEQIAEYEAGIPSTAMAYLGAMWRIDWLRERDMTMKSEPEPEMMKIEIWPIDQLIPYARNARKIPQAAIDKVAASIKEFGWRSAIVADAAGTVVAGHVRLLAARQLKLDRVPVHPAADMTPGQIRAFRLMDNRSHEETSWDLELLGPEIAELQVLNVDIALAGFDADEIAQFLGPAGSDRGKAPDAFKEYDESIPTAYLCPKCGYAWSGAAAPKPEPSVARSTAGEAAS
jgi:hypothetical protein